jgi:Polyribonucleotide nucleotidyltransferase (polynucleotide phosphorylase)
MERDGKKKSPETGKIARQAEGARTAQGGETMGRATVVGAKKVNPEVEHPPKTVNKQEKN